jgi:hypothetical protein
MLAETNTLYHTFWDIKSSTVPAHSTSSRAVKHGDSKSYHNQDEWADWEEPRSMITLGVIIIQKKMQAECRCRLRLIRCIVPSEILDSLLPSHYQNRDHESGWALELQENVQHEGIEKNLGAPKVMDSLAWTFPAVFLLLKTKGEMWYEGTERKPGALNDVKNMRWRLSALFPVKSERNNTTWRN